MTTEQQSLWSRIEAFSLDEPGAAFPFSERLAKENRWTIDRARRAIEEYKRFMFLGCAAGHAVSPSEDVDQVWHLHLVYTKSYWQDFCAQVLRQPFHHQPTKGGHDEAAKFEDWYANTLASYRKFFGEPPAEIWPAKPVHHELKWVDAARNWIVPKPKLAAYVATLGAAAVLVVAGCAGAGGANVFDYRGPEFLNFFFWFSVIVFVGAAIWRYMLIGQSAIPVKTPIVQNLDPYEIAYLAGKDLLATNAAIVNLIEQKHIAMRTFGDVELLHDIDENARFHPIERSLIDDCAVGVRTPLKDIRPRALPVLQKIHSELEQRGLLLPRRDSARAQILPLMMALMIPLVGLVKTIVGISRGKPVTYVFVCSLFSLLVILFYFARRPFQTHHGKRLLKDLRDENAGLRNPAEAGVTATAGMMPMALALFGMEALQGTSYARMRKQLEPQSGGEAGVSAAGCGGSSCGGGGGGCGGGGGGCGGCGGGGS